MSAAKPMSRSRSRAPSKGSGSASRKASRVRPSVTHSEASAMLVVGASSESSSCSTGPDDGRLTHIATSSTASDLSDVSQTSFSEAFDPELAIRFNHEFPIRTLSSLDEALLPQGISDYTFAPDGLLGKGKFSTVHLASKGHSRYAVKHTPLFQHHPLIVSRLLREPTILAQLPHHPNLVRVLETIRTPGNFYLVEEYLEGYVTLDSFTKSCPGGKLTIEQATIVLDQLVDVVRNALHRPIFIAHRDIKAENLLINPRNLHLILLDFGLSTHFSEKEPKLSTCCGSPAYHSPELWLGLRSPAGTVRYYGPEIDVWCCGVTLLRCLTGKRCPVGTSHASLAHLGEKVTDALLTIPECPLRHALVGFLHLDGLKRWDAFRQYKLSLICSEDKWRPNPLDRPLKSTSFLQSLPRYSLNLDLVKPQTLGPFSHRSSTAAESRTLHFNNPERHPNQAVISFFKYCLRCAGILYHQWPQATDPGAVPAFTTPALDPSAINPFDFSFARTEPFHLNGHTMKPIYFHCVMTPPATSNPRPSLLKRFHTSSTRSSSTPPNRSLENSGLQSRPVEALEFWVCIEPDTLEDSEALPAYWIRISDAKALPALQRALDSSSNEQAVRLESPWPANAWGQDEESDRGRKPEKHFSSSTCAKKDARPPLFKDCGSQDSSGSGLTLHSKGSRRSVSVDVLARS